MLAHLYIQDIVVIDKLSLSFAKGFSVFTGETGAGKSILLDALMLASGARADVGLIREGCDLAQVTAEFHLPPGHKVFELLEENGFVQKEPDVLMLRRLLSRDGKSRAFVNDQPISLTLLKLVSAQVLEIHSQFDRLLDSGDHRDFVDAFGGHQDLTQKVRFSFAAWKETAHGLEELYQTQEQEARDADIIAHHLEELLSFNPQEGEEETLLESRGKLQNLAKLQEALQDARGLLEGPNSFAHNFMTSQRNIGRLEAQYPEVTPLLTVFDQLSVSLDNTLGTLETLIQDVASRPSSLEEIEDRLAMLRTLARKHQVPPSQLLHVIENLQIKKTGFQNLSENIKDAETRAKVQREEYENLAARLTEAREKTAQRLNALVNQELPALKLERAKFCTRLTPLSSEKITGFGQELVTFEIAPNGGDRYGGLSDIASGGELARILLALKVVLMQETKQSLIIFDEIDSGVSGSVSTSIGVCLKKLCKNVQVFAITHSPQVAGIADTHILIEKSFDAEGRPFTCARPLTSEERTKEIARMISGHDITQEAQAAAHRLLRS